MGKNYQVIYLMSGAAHVPYLAASIWSLRKTGYDGPVTVFAWRESVGYVRKLEQDDRLNIWVSEREPKYRREDGLGRNSQGLDRISLSMSLDCDVSLYLDADTTVHGDLTPMFEVADRVGYCATQWCDWSTHRGHTRKRVLSLREFDGVPNDLIEEVVSRPLPSLNCGVFASKPTSPLLPQWYDWCLAAGRSFISDEKTQHLLMAAFPTQMEVLLGGAFNCSPKFQPNNLTDEDVVVRHYHGNSNTKEGKSEKGIALWTPIWQECLELNLGKIAGWWSDCGNKHLPGLMETI